MTDPTTPVTADPPEARVTLENFCRDLSTTDKRVELIAAFHFDERRSGNTMDVPSAYKARYVAFADKPVK